MTQETKEFKSMKVGIISDRKTVAIQTNVDRAIEALNDLYILVMANFETSDDNLEFLKKLVKSETPLYDLKYRYIMTNDYYESTRALNVEKVIKENLVDIEDFDDPINRVVVFQRVKSELNQLRFEFDFFKLFNEKSKQFEKNKELESAIEDATTVWTQTENQNKALRSLQKIRKGITELHELGALGGLNLDVNRALGGLSLALELDRKKGKIVISPYVFRRGLFKKIK